MLLRSNGIASRIRLRQFVRLLHNLSSHLPPLQQHLAFQFDTPHLTSLRLHAERGCRAPLASAPGASYSVDEIRRRLRKIVVHHVSHPVDVYAPSSNVSRHQNPVPAIAKPRQGLIPLILCPVAVHRYRWQSQPGEPLRQSIGRVLRSREYQK